MKGWGVNWKIKISGQYFPGFSAEVLRFSFYVRARDVRRRRWWRLKSNWSHDDDDDDDDDVDGDECAVWRMTRANRLFVNTKENHISIDSRIASASSCATTICGAILHALHLCRRREWSPSSATCPWIDFESIVTIRYMLKNQLKLMFWFHWVLSRYTKYIAQSKCDMIRVCTPKRVS